MSKNRVHTQSRVMHDVQTMTAAELEQEYGIEILEDAGSVWDPCEMKTFESIDEWAIYMQEQEREDAAFTSSSPKSGGKRRYEDDY